MHILTLHIEKIQEELSAPNVMQVNNQNMLMNQMQMMNNPMMIQNQAGYPQSFVPGQGQMTLQGQGQINMQGQNVHSDAKDPTMSFDLDLEQKTEDIQLGSVSSLGCSSSASDSLTYFDYLLA
jgi:hypothetical protein